jgi:hypothetical protein
MPSSSRIRDVHTSTRSPLEQSAVMWASVAEPILASRKRLRATHDRRHQLGHPTNGMDLGCADVQGGPSGDVPLRTPKLPSPFCIVGSSPAWLIARLTRFPFRGL